MRLGVGLPRHAGRTTTFARAAEALAFDSLWTGEVYNRGSMRADPFVLLALAAAVTERIELGSAIVQVPLHAPFLLASQAGSLATAADGRFVLGVGAGWNAGDFAATGTDVAARFRLLDRNLDAVRTLLRGDEVDGARLSPWEDLPEVPILIGTWASRRWLRRAALEFDGWIASAANTDLPQLLDGLKRFRDLAGPKRAVAASLDGGRPDTAEVLAALAEAGFDDAVVHVPDGDEEGLVRTRRLWPA